MNAAERWKALSAGMGIPDELVAQAPESPWRLDPAWFAADPVVAETRSRAITLEALPAGGSVLDVGCGAGAAAFRLVPPAGRVTGVDESEEMLAAFAAGAAGRGVACETVRGTWPAVAAIVAPADVLVCNHVLYNVSDLVPFLHALTARARSRVVVEITEEHPRAWLQPFWRAIWNLERPEPPAAEHAIAVCREAGIDPRVERSHAPRAMAGLARADLVAAIRRMTCAHPHHDPAIEAVLDAGALGDERSVVTLWWQGDAA